MKIRDLSICNAEIKKVTNSSVLFSGAKATVNIVVISLESKGYSDEVTCSISIDRKQARKLIKELQTQLKIRNGSGYISWMKRRK